VGELPGFREALLSPSLCVCLFTTGAPAWPLAGLTGARSQRPARAIGAAARRGELGVWRKTQKPGACGARRAPERRARAANHAGAPPPRIAG